MTALCSNPRLPATVRRAMEPLVEMLGIPAAQRRSITPDPDKLRGTASCVYIKDKHILESPDMNSSKSTNCGRPVVVSTAWRKC
jgi:hypothetical protein